MEFLVAILTKINDRRFLEELAGVNMVFRYFG